jgi:hypothetical protein
MTDISLIISNAFTATQLIVVFVIFLFTFFYPEIQSIKNQEIEEEESNIATNLLVNQIKETFWGRCVILFFSNLLVFILFLPVFIQILITLKQNWSFNYEIYSFILIFIFISGFLLWSLLLTYQLFDRIKELKKLNFLGTVKYLLRGRISKNSGKIVEKVSKYIHKLKSALKFD